MIMLDVGTYVQDSCFYQGSLTEGRVLEVWLNCFLAGRTQSVIYKKQRSKNDIYIA